MARKRRPSPETEEVLIALADRGIEWSYGYDLCGRLGLKAGTMYPILMRLADRGQVETSWETDVPRGRPPRHLYRLTATGAELVEEIRADRSAMSATAPQSPPPRPAFGSATA